MPVPQGDFMFLRETKKLIYMYSVLPARQPEGNQIAFFNPPQYSYFTHTAIPGNRAGSEILRVSILWIVFHIIPPENQ